MPILFVRILTYAKQYCRQLERLADWKTDLTMTVSNIIPPRTGFYNTRILHQLIMLRCYVNYKQNKTQQFTNTSAIIQFHLYRGVNLTSASQCARSRGHPRSKPQRKTACNRTQLLVLEEHHFKTRPTISTFCPKKDSAPGFPRMLSVLDVLGESAARCVGGVGYAAELSFRSHPFVVVLEREGVFKPVQIHFFKAVPSVSTWNPAPC